MSEEPTTVDLTHRLLRDIQRELADIRDDRTVIVAILNRLDAGVTSLSTEVRALRSQFGRFRSEVRAAARGITLELLEMPSAG